MCIGTQARSPVHQKDVGIAIRVYSYIFYQHWLWKLHGVEASPLVQRKTDGVGGPFGAMVGHHHQTPTIANFVYGSVIRDIFPSETTIT